MFAVIENGSEDFEQPDTKAEGLQVRNLLRGSCWKCVWVFISSMLFPFEYTNMKETKNHHMPRQLYYSKTICCSFFFFFKSRLRLSSQQFCKSASTAVNLEAALSSLKCAETLVTGERTGSAGWKIWELGLSRIHVAPPYTPRQHSCISQDSDGNLFFLPQQIIHQSWHPCVNVQLWALFCFSEVMRWDEKEKKKNIEPTWR